MECKIKGIHLRVMARSFRSLSKIGESVYIQTSDNGMKMQSINETNSAFVEFEFEKNFFDSFESSEPIQIKLSIRSLIFVFHQLTLDRHVQCCTIQLSGASDRVRVTMECTNRITRKYHLPYMESLCLKFKDTTVNQPITLRTDSKYLNQIFQYFGSGVNDITIMASKEAIKFKNYVDEDTDIDITDTLMRSNRINFHLYSKDFEEYNVTEPLIVTFTMRDVKSFLYFSLFKDLKISAKLSQENSGSPISFSAQSVDALYRGKILLATFELPNPISFSPIRTSSSFAHSQSIRHGDESIYSNQKSQNNFHTEASFDQTNQHTSGQLSGIANEHSGQNATKTTINVAPDSLEDQHDYDDDDDGDDDDDDWIDYENPLEIILFNEYPDLSYNDATQTIRYQNVVHQTESVENSPVRTMEVESDGE